MQTRSPGGANLAYFIFDVLHLDGEDLLALPVERRKERLRSVLGETPLAPLRYVDHVIGGGAAFSRPPARCGSKG
jgi:bifunctional non-homologous end joining protein LigD